MPARGYDFYLRMFNSKTSSNFPKISEDFRKFSEDCPKFIRTFPIISDHFRKCLKMPEDFRR